MAIPLRKKDKISGEQPVPVLIQREEHLSLAPARQAFITLRTAYVLIPMIAGLDKFYDLVTSWDAYLSPSINGAVGISAHSFMAIVGLIEIVLGLGVAVSPRIFGSSLAIWMLAIVGNLVLLGGHSDVVLMTLGLAAGAFALGRLGQQFEPVPRRRLQALQ